MRTAYQVITVAAKSSAECAASDSSASEPEKTPTTALPMVRPPEAAIEVSATRSLTSCMRAYLSCARKISSRFCHCVTVFANESHTQFGCCVYIVDAADALT